ncbi:MAG: GIY-YIG nuclease family protein [Clostridia bacterium]|nr:GIY-YIG nuclease family protein [Clostridia bacterium]
MYNYLKRKGYDAKYERAGIYCIKIDNTIVYIGKSTNMLKRVSQHYVGIKMQSESKYKILAEI